ncbi:hypothetical protein IFM89_008265, partial [Coptis chinensis]
NGARSVNTAEPQGSSEISQVQGPQSEVVVPIVESRPPHEDSENASRRTEADNHGTEQITGELVPYVEPILTECSARSNIAWSPRAVPMSVLRPIPVLEHGMEGTGSSSLQILSSSVVVTHLEENIPRQYAEDEPEQLKNCEAERDQAIENSKEAREQINKLESKVKEMSDLLLEAGDAQEQLIHVINELNATKEELHNAKAELSAAEESKVSAMKEVELMATAVDMEKEKTEELLRCVSEFNDVVLLSKVAAIEAGNKYSIILSEKEKKLQVAAIHAQE